MSLIVMFVHDLQDKIKNLYQST